MDARWNRTAFTAAALLAFGAPAAAATHCVNPGGRSGCAATISAAVAAASPGDTVVVAAGTYDEDVVIDKPLTLVGEQRERTIIDATGLANGITIDGLNNGGIADIAVSGFTIRNAGAEGILITNASDVRITGNRVIDNDRALVSGSCTLILPPDTPQGEGIDCGEAIHLSAVDHSTIASNLVEHNSGGILVTDDSGPTHDNLVVGNTVSDNAYDCGITLASHLPVSPNGVFHNTVADNRVTRNGLEGEGAGVGLFTPAPGTATYGNVVIGNVLVGNRMPGVAMHSHAPNQVLNDNQIVGNYLSGNGADANDAATAGPTGINVFGVSPITGTIISGNIVDREAIGVAVRVQSRVDVHGNDLGGSDTGVANLGTGPVDASENWWGCPAGPGAHGCAGVSGDQVTVVPWLRRPIESRFGSNDRGPGKSSR